MRQYYSDVFHTIHWFQIGDYAQVEGYFLDVYSVAADSGIIMPFVEYGKQIIPLLEYVRDRNLVCSTEWIAKVLLLAEQYEENLNAYRN